METDIIHIAVENLAKTTGIRARWTPKGPLDGITRFQMNGKTVRCVTEIKRELRQYHVHQLEDYNYLHDNLLVVANRIFPKIKKQLKDKGIAYLEANGNVFMNKDGMYVFVDTNEPHKAQNAKGNRAFTKTGLKVVLHFLMDPQLINRTHREIAEKVNVGLGNIPQVIEGLRTTGYIIPWDKRNYVWENKRELIHRWINAYATELRPKTIIGTFKVPENWRNLGLRENTTVWGGEPAADMLTNYLRPEKYILHTREEGIDLMKKYRLVPAEDGKLEVLEMFWRNEHPRLAPPILVYAELILEGGKRNEETAKRIFDEFIEPDL